MSPTVLFFFFCFSLGIMLGLILRLFVFFFLGIVLSLCLGLRRIGSVL